MRTRRARVETLGRWLVTALVVCIATTGCGIADQLGSVDERVPHAPSVPPLPPPPDEEAAAAPIDGALWEVDGHPASIRDVRVVSGGRIAYLSSWADVGFLTPDGDVAPWPRIAARGWMGSQLDAWPHGPLLAAVTNAGIEVWDADSGLALGLLRRPWTTIAVSPDGARIAVAVSTDGGTGLLIWDPVFATTPSILADLGRIDAFTWSPDGTTLAIASDALLLVDLERGDVVWRGDLDAASGASLRWHPEAPLVAHIVDSTVTVFDVERGERSSSTLPAPVARGHWTDTEHLMLLTEDGDVLSFAHASGSATTIGSVPPFTLGFEPLDDARAVISTRSGSVGIWDFVAGEAERLVAPAMGRGEAVALSSDGLRLVTGGHNGLVRTWRVADGAMLAERQMGETRVEELAWSPDGLGIAVVHGSRIDLLDGTTLALLASADGYYRGALAFDEAGRLLVSGGSVLDGSTLEPISSTSSSHHGFAAAWGPEGSSIAVGRFDGDVKIFDASTSELVASIPTGLESVAELAWSPDGTVIAAASYLEIVAIDAGTGERRFALPLHGVLTSLTYSPDSSALVTSGWASTFGGGCTDTVRYWDAVSGAPLGGLGGTSTAGGVALSSDGRHTALTNWRGKVAYAQVPDLGP